MSFNSEGKDHSLTQKRQHCWLTLAGEGWWTFSPRLMLPRGVWLWQSSLTCSDILTGKTLKMGNQPPRLHSCPAVESLLRTAPASSITILSTTQTATLGAATVHEFVSRFLRTPESPLSSQTATPLNNQNAAHTSMVPTLPKSLQRHETFPGITGEIKAVVSVTKT